MLAVNKTLVYLLIFTIVSSALAYIIILKGYDTYLPDNDYAIYN